MAALIDPAKQLLDDELLVAPSLCEQLVGEVAATAGRELVRMPGAARR